MGGGYREEVVGDTEYVFLSFVTALFYFFFARTVGRRSRTCYLPWCGLYAIRKSAQMLYPASVSWGSEIAALGESSTCFKIGFTMPRFEGGFDFGGNCYGRLP